MTQGTSNNLGKCTGGAEIEQVIFLFLADCSVEVSRGGGGGLSPPPFPLGSDGPSEESGHERR